MTFIILTSLYNRSDGSFWSSPVVLWPLISALLGLDCSLMKAIRIQVQ